jgi:Pyruvate/2-oxoacid:ferredoxin oxidoreductase gamma subunit
MSQFPFTTKVHEADSGDTLVVESGGKLSIQAGAIVEGLNVKQYVFHGAAAAGPVTVTGVKVGDKVLSVSNLTDVANDASYFESTVTVNNQIQQTSASNLTTKTYVALVLAAIS